LDSVHTSGTTPGKPASFACPSSLARLSMSGALLVALGLLAYLAHGYGRASIALSILFGAAFGIVLQRSRFCFFCNFRDWFDTGDGRGLVGIIVALAVGTIGYALVFGAWLPDPSTGRLPPDAFIGPISPLLLAAGLAFGCGMAISGSCVSAHLYRLGEGSPTAPFALAGTAAGFVLGFRYWNELYVRWVADAPIVWLPRPLGYAGWLVTTLGVLLALALFISRRPVRDPQAAGGTRFQRVFTDRWSPVTGGAIVGVIAMAAYLRVAPLGVTAEIGGVARQWASSMGIAPDRLEGLDTLRGCVTIARDMLVSNNGAFVGSLVIASFAAAITARQFKPSLPGPGQIVRGLVGGVLLGWGAMVGLGCTVGTLLSGIMAGALSGWVFGAAVFVGVAATLCVERTVRSKLVLSGPKGR
jgi:uncharacterized protein